MPDLYVDETLEAVALVLRDVKNEFEERLKSFSGSWTEQEDKIFQRLAETSESIQLALSKIESRHKAIENFSAETRQRIEALTDRLEDKIAAATAETQKEIRELQAGDEGLQESILSLTTGIEEAGRSISATTRTLSTADEHLGSNIRGANDRIDELREQFGRHYDALERLRDKTARVEVIEVGLSDLSGNLLSLEKTLASLAEEIDNVKAGHQTVHASLVEVDNKSVSKGDVDSLVEGLVKRQDFESVRESLEETASKASTALSVAQGLIVQTDRSLQEQQDRMQESIERVRTAFADRLQEAHAKISGLRQQLVEGLGAELSSMIDARAKLSDRMLMDQADKLVTKLSENIRGERGPAGYLSRVQRWVEDYQFSELSLVRHRAGLWQALRDTSQEPQVGEDSDWLLISAGIDEVVVAANEAIPGGHFLTLKDSSGLGHTIEIRIPMPRFHKTWEPDRQYRYYDSVMEDGHRWLAVADRPEGQPTRSDDWVLFGMRGSRGARGAPGDRGPVGPSPSPSEILETYTRHLEEAGGTPISSYRGSWQYGTDYRVGDLVRGDGVLALCLENHSADKPPGGPGQGQWEILFRFSSTGPDGVGESNAPGGLKQ